MSELAIYIGWDPREQEAYDVCENSIKKRATIEVEIRPIKLDRLRDMGLYRRATEIRDNKLWDTISGAPMSTEFAISRFFVPFLAADDNVKCQWAMFCDCDFLWLGDIKELLCEVKSEKALGCVQHLYEPKETLKMDGQAQLLYKRKNWSSMMMFNLRHPSNNKLNIELLNSLPGRDLHRFCWLQDNEIQAVSQDWNWLEGTYPRVTPAPRAIHYTRGGPWMTGWEDVDYAEEWRDELQSTLRGNDNKV